MVTVGWFQVLLPLWLTMEIWKRWIGNQSILGLLTADWFVFHLLEFSFGQILNKILKICQDSAFNYLNGSWTQAILKALTFLPLSQGITHIFYYSATPTVRTPLISSLEYAFFQSHKASTYNRWMIRPTITEI